MASNEQKHSVTVKIKDEIKEDILSKTRKPETSKKSIYSTLLMHEKKGTLKNENSILDSDSLVKQKDLKMDEQKKKIGKLENVNHANELVIVELRNEIKRLKKEKENALKHINDSEINTNTPKHSEDDKKRFEEKYEKIISDQKSDFDDMKKNFEKLFVQHNLLKQKMESSKLETKVDFQGNANIWKVNCGLWCKRYLDMQGKKEIFRKLFVNERAHFVNLLKLLNHENHEKEIKKLSSELKDGIDQESFRVNFPLLKSVKDGSVGKKKFKLIYGDNEYGKEIRRCNFSISKVPHRFGASFRQYFTVKYLGKRRFPNLTLWIRRNNLYNLSRQDVDGKDFGKEDKKLYVPVEYNDNPSLDDLKDADITVEIKTRDSDFDCKRSTLAIIKVKKSIDEVAVPTLKRLIPKERKKNNYNILIFGPSKGGRSSFINSILTLVNPGNDIVQYASSSGVGDQYETRDYRFYNIPMTNINLLDIWGVEKGYSVDVVEMLAKGIFPRQWKLGDKYILSKFKESIKTRNERRIHCAMFVVPFNVLDEEKNEKLKFYKEALQNMTKFVRYIYIMVTFCDNVCPEIRKDPFNWEKIAKKETVKKINERMKNILDEFGVGDDKKGIVGLMYYKEKEKNYMIDIHNLKILEKLVKRANDFEDITTKNVRVEEKINLSKFTSVKFV